MPKGDDVDLNKANELPQSIAKTDLLERAEIFVALSLSLLVLFLLLVRAQHAGALWRDECTSMRLAELTTIEPIRERLPYTLLFPALVRIHTSMFGPSDLSMRSFGAGVGVMLIAVCWIYARLVRSGPPLVLLTLIGLNSTFLTWGTNIRGYGLGTVMIILAAGLAAGILVQRSRWKIAALLVAGLCAPQLLVHDAPLVVAIVLAAMVVSFARRQRKVAFILFCVAVLIVAACLPFFGASAYRDAHIILKFHTSLAEAWQNFKTAFGQPSAITTILWGVTFLASAVAAISGLRKIDNDISTERNLFFFALLAVISSVAGFFVFLRLLDYWPHPWYYLPLLGVFAVAIDLMFNITSRFLAMRWVRLSLVIGLAPMLAFFAWPAVIKRQTNVDLIAANLEQEATADDLIVLNPCDLGVSFNRYYHGSAPFVTVPMMEDHSRHRYDLLKKKMMTTNPLDDLFAEMARALQSGHRVWVIGYLRLLQPNEIPHWLPPAPESEFGWNNDAYRNSWSQELAAFLQAHADHLNIKPAPGDHINGVENHGVWLFDGWRE